VELLRSKPQASLPARVKDKVRGLWKRTRDARAEGGGIDDSKLPSGFEAPYRRGSRMVRNLWHIPF
jgi:hypothetical protein